eukprot:2051439-Amphidinium_carterae.2
MASARGVCPALDAAGWAMCPAWTCARVPLVPSPGWAAGHETEVLQQMPDRHCARAHALDKRRPLTVRDG